MLKAFYYLTKPGIVWGNAITAVAGFFVASGQHPRPDLFLATLIGLCLVVASACVFNNYTDRAIDAKMARTKRRALVSGRISGPVALAYGTILGLLGTLTLVVFTNLLATMAALFGWVAYVLIYGYWKRRSWVGTLVGSISGAIPPVVGYVAVTGRLDLTSLLLFLIVAFWQMPHFYAIAINRANDYQAAGIPVLPVSRGVEQTRYQIMLFMILFVLSSITLYVVAGLDLIYLVAITVVDIWWLVLALVGFRSSDTLAWARSMFGFSLVVICVWCIAICVASVVG